MDLLDPMNPLSPLNPVSPLNPNNTTSTSSHTCTPQCDHSIPAVAGWIMIGVVALVVLIGGFIAWRDGGR